MHVALSHRRSVTYALTHALLFFDALTGALHLNASVNRISLDRAADHRRIVKLPVLSTNGQRKLYIFVNIQILSTKQSTLPCSNVGVVEK
ncbi:hypothetical protein C8R44DRAFT_813862 [Mycena epipterygia]|nr:hypothetical protein C8R44DRAFT_813862 [Mycena epipterygia]